MYNTLMLVLTNFVQVLTAHNYHNCDVLYLTLPSPFKEPCPQGEGIVAAAGGGAPK